MAGYAKLSSALITSTVWRESATTRVVWITLLALANAHGEVEGSVPGLADLARVTLAECETALDRLRAPDPYSRTKEREGRRLEDRDGGWFIVNYDKYRDLYSTEHRRDLARERQRRHRSRHAVTRDVTLGNACHDKQYAEAEAEATTTTKTTTAPTRKKRESGAGHDTWLTPAFDAWESRFEKGSFPTGQAAHYLAPLRKAGHSPEQIGAYLAWYLDARGDEHAHLKDDPTRRGVTGWAPNLKVFRDTFGKWNPAGGQPAAGQRGVA